MAAKKKTPPPQTETRTYTGFNGNANGALPGTVKLRDVILFLNQDKFHHLGTFQIRPARGKPGQPSVHGTGRAFDLGWKTRQDATRLCDWLTNNADLLGLELLADYFPAPWGRAWRCDRAAWKVYDRRTIAGAPGGQWVHVEISPQLAHNAAAMEAAIIKALT